jgi:lipoprotein-releasing system ATP-binding protein
MSVNAPYTPASSDVIVLQDVHKIYSIQSQSVAALNGINLTVQRGAVISVTGKSGSGKSTLLHILGTLDRPSRGRMWLNGVDVLSLSDVELSLFRNKAIGFVFQMKNLLPEFSALENVMMPGLIAGEAKRSVQERARYGLDAVGLSHRIHHRPGELSGGEQQRVAIARALLNHPPILLADEPTGNLDQKTSLAIQDLLLELCDRLKLSMLLVTHDPDLASRLPKRIVMEDGIIADRGIH